MTDSVIIFDAGSGIEGTLIVLPPEPAEEAERLRRALATNADILDALLDKGEDPDAKPLGADKAAGRAERIMDLQEQRIRLLREYGENECRRRA